MSQRMYIAGPMTGLPQLNFPSFHAAAAEYRAKGFDVVNPAEINIDPTAGWIECMRKDIAQLVTCSEITMLPGWESSRGAQLERHIALLLEMKINYHPINQVGSNYNEVKK